MTREGVCTSPGCGRTTIVAKGMCNAHYKQWYKNRSPEEIANTKIGRPRDENPSYSMVHSRLKRKRGLARDHQCADCGKTAQHWSYNGSCPDERRGPEEHGRGDLPYCEHEDHYSPRCALCHKAHDTANHLRGEDHPNAKITLNEARWMRQMHAMGKYTSIELGKIFGMNASSARRILRGERYKDLPPS